MTRYTDAELRDNWEFKIVRANTRAFRKPEVLQRVCEEEARAGWVLVEKFDDSRLRFKRPVSARAGDRTLEGDPYRTTYGVSELTQVAIILAVVFLCILLVVVFAVQRVH